MRHLISRYGIVLMLISSILFSCNNRSKDVDLGKIIIKNVKVHRYEEALFSINPEQLQQRLPAIASEFNLFLGDQYLEPANLLRLQSFISDTAMQSLFRATMRCYPDLTSQSAELTNAFRYFKYYFPNKTTPEVYSYISGLDVDNTVRYSADGIIISLDLFLGANEPIYSRSGLPRYKTERMTREHITPLCMEEIGRSMVIFDETRQSLLDMMVAEGKVLYFADITLPKTIDALKIGYSTAQLDWCIANEARIWAFLVENNLLYTTDPEAVGKMMTDAPFTSGFGQESPGRIGAWVGWQIVKNYMQRNPDELVEKMMQEKDSQKILEGSRYKPRK
jgi:hypothetical protein